MTKKVIKVEISVLIDLTCFNEIVNTIPFQKDSVKDISSWNEEYSTTRDEIDKGHEKKLKSLEVLRKRDGIGLGEILLQRPVAYQELYNNPKKQSHLKVQLHNFLINGTKINAELLGIFPTCFKIVDYVHSIVLKNFGDYSYGKCEYENCEHLFFKSRPEKKFCSLKHKKLHNNNSSKSFKKQRSSFEQKLYLYDYLNRKEVALNDESLTYKRRKRYKVHLPLLMGYRNEKE